MNGQFGILISKRNNHWTWVLRHELEPEYPERPELNQFFIFQKGKGKNVEDCRRQALVYLRECTICQERKRTSDFVQYVVA